MNKGIKITITVIGIIADVIGIYQIFKNGLTMNIHTIFWICFVAFVTIVLIMLNLYWSIKNKLSALDRYSDSKHDNLWDIVDLHEIINRRKTKLLYDTLKKAGVKVESPKSFLSDYEKKLFTKLSDKRIKEIEEANNDFNSIK